MTTTVPEPIEHRAQRIVAGYHELLNRDRGLAGEVANTLDEPLDVAQRIVAGIDSPITRALDAQFIALETGIRERLFEAAA